MDRAEIFALCWVIVCVFIILPILYQDKKRFDSLDGLRDDRRTKRKRKIEKELKKFNRKPDLILCKPYYLEATTFSVIPEIGGVPIVYAGLWGKPYIFVWFDEFYRELNEKCEKILKEQKK